MGKKVLIVTTSLRAHSNSDRLAEAFAEGAKAAGHDVETVSLKGKKIAFCKGCMACQKTKRCVIRDDGIDLAEKVKNAQVVVFATPVYYYGPSGQMKTVLDRCNPLFTTDYRFRDVYLAATAAEDEDDTIEGTQKGLQGWIDCFENARLAGVVFAGGVNDIGEIRGHKALEEAYEMGKAV